MATRHTLNDAYRGGRVHPEEPVEDKPNRPRYPCFAEGCPMAGTIFPGAGVGGTGDRPGTCAWHYGIVPTDIPKVTRVLLDWQCVAVEVREARRALTGEIASDPKALAIAFSTAWERLQPLVTGWEDQLAPGTIRTSKGADTRHRQSYGDWAKHLERFIGARVVEVLTTHLRRAA
jgi:hypothetical protein